MNQGNSNWMIIKQQEITNDAVDSYKLENNCLGAEIESLDSFYLNKQLGEIPVHASSRIRVIIFFTRKCFLSNTLKFSTALKK